jgi:hypothetical protein
MERRKAFVFAGTVTASTLAAATALGATTGLLGFGGSASGTAAPASASQPAQQIVETKIVHIRGTRPAPHSSSALHTGSTPRGGSPAAAPTPTAKATTPTGSTGSGSPSPAAGVTAPSTDTGTVTPPDPTVPPPPTTTEPPDDATEPPAAGPGHPPEAETPDAPEKPEAPGTPQAPETGD